LTNTRVTRLPHPAATLPTDPGLAAAGARLSAPSKKTSTVRERKKEKQKHKDGFTGTGK
jgi:hypothetical protein